MDLLGHGLTGAYPDDVYTRHAQRDMLIQLLKALNISKYTLAGKSFDGGIALEAALEHPKQLEGLILVNSEGVPNSEGGYDVSLLPIVWLLLLMILILLKYLFQKNWPRNLLVQKR